MSICYQAGCVCVFVPSHMYNTGSSGNNYCHAGCTPGLPHVLTHRNCSIKTFHYTCTHTHVHTHSAILFNAGGNFALILSSLPAWLNLFYFWTNFFLFFSCFLPTILQPAFSTISVLFFLEISSLLPSGFLYSSYLLLSHFRSIGIKKRKGRHQVPQNSTNTPAISTQWE